MTTARLVTTPILLVVLARTEAITVDAAETLLDELTDARSRSGNAYVARARETLRRT